MSDLQEYDVSYGYDAALRPVPNKRADMERAVRHLLDVAAGAGGLERARSLGMAGMYQAMLGELVSAEALLTEARDLVDAAGEVRQQVVMRLRLGQVLQWQARYDEADALFADVLSRCRRDAQVADYLDFALQHAGKSKFDQGDYQAAEEYFVEALALREQKENAELIESTALALAETRRQLEKFAALHARIYWLNGSPCAGKSTVATAVAQRLDWRIYHCDDWDEAHRQRATPERHPTFHQIAQLRGDALWLRPVAEQLESEIRYHGEQFTLVLEDLLRLADEDERPLLCEGSAGLPHLLQPILPNRHHAFWLIPSEAFQRHYYAQRPWVAGILATTSDPERAFDNWMRRDAGFAHWLEEQAALFDMPWLSVDGSLTVAETVEQVALHYYQSPP